MSYSRRIVTMLAVGILTAGCGAGSAGSVEPSGGSGSGPGGGPGNGSGSGPSGGATGGAVPPVGGTQVPPSAGWAADGRPAPFPAGDPPSTPSLTPLSPAPGRHERVAAWHLAGTADGGRRLLLDVTIGGPPCDAVTGLDVSQTTTTVTVTVHAGRLHGASCPAGATGSLATARVEALLAAPLGSRQLRGGS